jgi:hypothetical protein
MLVISATWEIKIGKLTVQGQLGQKVLKTSSQTIVGCGGVHL